MYPNNQLSTNVYAPDNSGFTHTSPEQFSYFFGSATGTQKTFGMTSKELAKLFAEFATKFSKQYENNADKKIKEQIDKLNQLANHLSAIDRDSGTYKQNQVVAEGVVRTG